MEPGCLCFVRMTILSLMSEEMYIRCDRNQRLDSIFVNWCWCWTWQWSPSFLYDKEYVGLLGVQVRK
jgi:hypothetical protein